MRLAFRIEAGNIPSCFSCLQNRYLILPHGVVATWPLRRINGSCSFQLKTLPSWKQQRPNIFPRMIPLAR